MNVLFDDTTNEELIEDKPTNKPEKIEEKEGGGPGMMTILLIVLIGALLAYIAYQNIKKEE